MKSKKDMTVIQQFDTARSDKHARDSTLPGHYGRQSGAVNSSFPALGSKTTAARRTSALHHERKGSALMAYRSIANGPAQCLPPVAPG